MGSVRTVPWPEAGGVMFRAVAAFAGFILTLTGLAGSLATWANTEPELWAPNGWTVLAGAGVALLAVDLLVEEYQHREGHS